MPDSLFQTLTAEANSAGITRRTIQARDWFIKRARSITNVNRRQLLKDPVLITKNRPLPGKMFMFVYDPKGKAELPYYDKFPLILMVGPAEGGFYGLNLHYLNPFMRAKFLDKLMQYASSKELNENTKIRMSYQMLTAASKLKEFGPCFKHYLKDHIRSTIEMVPATEWDIACFMPLEQFTKKDKNFVWKESKSMI